MPSKASKEKRKATRAMENAQQKDGAKSAQHSTEPNSTTVTAVDGKQATAGTPQMQKTAHHGHGKQSERGNCSEPQETTRLVSVSGNLATKMQAPTATRAHTASSYLQSVPGAKAYVETFGMQYALSAKGLSDIQIRRACEKAWLETFHQMGIVLDKQYEPEQIHQFHNAVRAKADRIVECKRRRCARSKRQPTTDCATDKV